MLLALSTGEPGMPNTLKYTGQFFTIRNYSAPYTNFECLARHSCMTYGSSAKNRLFPHFLHVDSL